jgi:DNA-binding transcriptional LysR family regulator
MKLGQLRSFVAVAETGALAAAARRVGRTPSAVSMSLKQLEETLGGSLFEGERKGRLTPLGEHCLQVARRMVEDHEAGQEEMLRFAAGGDGEVRIAAVPSAACGLVAAALALHRAASVKDGIGVRAWRRAIRCSGGTSASISGLVTRVSPSSSAQRTGAGSAARGCPGGNRTA